MAAPSVSLRDSYALNYRPADYTPQNRDRTLHFLIALNQPLETVQKYCAKFPDRINVPDPKNYHLRPLSLAVACGRKDVAQSLLQSKADPLAQDAFGFTALHHAALLPDQTTLNLLVKEVNQAGLNQLRCQFGGTWQDLRRIVKEPAMAPDEVVGTYNGKNLTAQGFKDLTGANYCRRVHSTPEMLIRYHRKDVKVTIENEALHAKDPLLVRFEKDPPKLCLTDEIEGIGIGVKTGQNLKREEISCLYEGDLIDASAMTHGLDHFQLGIVDGQKKRGIAAHINDGPPNCYFHPITNYNGLPEQYALLAIEPIEEGTTLYWNYGSQHPIKTGKYILTDQMIGTLHDFFKKHSCKQLLKGHIKPYSLEFHMMNYIFETPAAFIHLLLDGTLKSEDAEIVLKAKKSTIFIPSNYRELYLSIIQNLILLKKFNSPAHHSLIDLQKSMTVFAYIEAIQCIRLLKYNEMMSENFCEHFATYGKVVDILVSGSKYASEDEKKTDDISDLVSKLPQTWKNEVSKLKECLK